MTKYLISMNKFLPTETVLNKLFWIDISLFVISYKYNRWKKQSNWNLIT